MSRAMSFWNNVYMSGWVYVCVVVYVVLFQCVANEVQGSTQFVFVCLFLWKFWIKRKSCKCFFFSTLSLALDSRCCWFLFIRLLASHVKCDSLHKHMPLDGRLCDLCLTYNRCTFAYVYRKTWHTNTKLSLSFALANIFNFSCLFVSQLLSHTHATIERKGTHKKGEKNITSSKFHQASSTHFPRVFFGSLYRLIIRINFANINDTQPLNRIYLTRNNRPRPSFQCDQNTTFH